MYCSKGASQIGCVARVAERVVAASLARLLRSMVCQRSV